MAGSTDIIVLGVVVIGGIAVYQNWDRISGWLQSLGQNQQQAYAQGQDSGYGSGSGSGSSGSGGSSSSSSSPSPSSSSSLSPVANTPKAKAAGYVPNQPVCLGGDTDCYARAKSQGLTASAYAYPGYYRGYNLNVMGPSWKHTVPASTGPDNYGLDDRYRSYQTTIDPNSGAKIVTIDRFFPAGMYLSQANYTSSLKEPALH